MAPRDAESGPHQRLCDGWSLCLQHRADHLFGQHLLATLTLQHIICGSHLPLLMHGSARCFGLLLAAICVMRENLCTNKCRLGV